MSTFTSTVLGEAVCVGRKARAINAATSGRWLLPHN